MPLVVQRHVRVRKGLEAKWPQASSLEKFGTQLGFKMRLTDFDYDAENVYEWGQALTEDGHVEVNISRRHGYVPPASDFVSVILLVSKDAPPEWDSQWVTEHLLPQYEKVIATIIGENCV